jgi:sulfate adenylyltransferase
MSAPLRPGVTVFLTGLSGAGKSTIADALVASLEAEGRPVTVLDGDVVRTHLSSELTFSREHRDLNIRRIGFVAGEVVKHGGTVVVAAIAPYEQAREEARALVEKHGRFLLVHVATPLEVAEQRDVKGLYAKARAGVIPHFTGVSDPYEAPGRAELTIDTSVTPLEESVALIRAAIDAE